MAQLSIQVSQFTFYTLRLIPDVFASGPKRYDYDPVSSSWVYPRDSTAMTTLLAEELTNIFGRNIVIQADPTPS